MVTTQTNMVQIENLSPDIQKHREGHVGDDNRFIPAIENQQTVQPVISAPIVEPLSSHPTLPAAGSTFDEIEKKAFLEALNRANGKVPQAAKALGISRATFYRKIKKYRSAT
jgi:transcriptional regulator of acetoin/glycerol metabolism